MLTFEGPVVETQSGFSLRFVDKSGKTVSVQISNELMHDCFGIYDVTTADVADCALEIGEVANKMYRGVSPMAIHTHGVARV